MPYSEVSIVGYNANPPEDDGSAVTTNAVAWSKHTSKIGDPLKDAIESTQSNITTIIDAIESDISNLESNLYAPSGTLMLFQQTAAPTNWTKSATHNNKALRVVSGTASSGGSTAFTSVFTSRTISQANLPSVSLSSGSLSVSLSNATNVYRGTATTTILNGTGSSFTGIRQGGSNSTLTASVSGTVPLGGSDTAMDFAVQYVDIILASKD